jgi:hypothetical protein
MAPPSSSPIQLPLAPISSNGRQERQPRRHQLPHHVASAIFSGWGTDPARKSSFQPPTRHTSVRADLADKPVGSVSHVLTRKALLRAPAIESGPQDSLHTSHKLRVRTTPLGVTSTYSRHCEQKDHSLIRSERSATMISHNRVVLAVTALRSPIHRPSALPSRDNHTIERLMLPVTVPRAHHRRHLPCTSRPLPDPSFIDRSSGSSSHH